MRLARAVVISAVALAVLAIALPHAAAAQGTSASIQGTIVDEAGPLPGATIVAKDTSSGFRTKRSPASTGTFTLSGLRPGTYEITVTMNQFKPQSRTVQVQVGQSITANFKVDAGRALHRTGAGRRQLAARRDPHVGDRDDRHDRRGALPAAEPAQLPELRRARAGRAASRTTRPASRSPAAASTRRRSTSSSTASATRTTSSTAASSARTRAAGHRSRRRRCRSSRS